MPHPPHGIAALSVWCCLQSNYSSVSIYAEVKLKEAMRMDANAKPSTFRAGPPAASRPTQRRGAPRGATGRSVHRPTQRPAELIAVSGGVIWWRDMVA